MAASGAGAHDSPRSAWARAAASLTPSPTIATTLPCARNCVMTSTLSCGRDLGDDLVDADVGRHGPGHGRVVTGEQHRGQSQGPQLTDRLAELGLTASGDDEDAAGPPVPADRDEVPPVAWASVAPGQGTAASDQSARSCGRPTTIASDSRRRRRRPGRRVPEVGEVLDRRQRRALLAGAGDGSGNGVLGGDSRAAAYRSVVADSPTAAVTSAASSARRHGARLVEDDGVDLAGDSRTSGPLMRMPIGRRAGADHEGGRVASPRGARAGDDEHGDGRGEGHGGNPAPLTSQKMSVPRARRARSGRRCPRSGRRGAAPAPAVLGVPDEAPSARAGCRRPHASRGRRGGRRIEGRAGHGVPGADLDGHRFTGEHEVSIADVPCR